MGVLGEFQINALGKFKGLRTDLDAHTAATGAIHGAVVAATASQLMLRDGSGRSKVADPAVDADIATKKYVDDNSGAGTVTSVVEGTGMNFSVTPITGAGTINLANTAVTPGVYTNSDITVDAQGRITSASNGTAAGTNLGESYAATTVTVTSSTGTDVTLNAATTSLAGMMTGADKTKLDNIETGADVTDATNVAAAGAELFTITSSSTSPSGGVNGDVHFEY